MKWQNSAILIISVLLTVCVQWVPDESFTSRPSAVTMTWSFLNTLKCICGRCCSLQIGLVNHLKCWSAILTSAFDLTLHHFQCNSTSLSSASPKLSHNWWEARINFILHCKYLPGLTYCSALWTWLTPIRTPSATSSPHIVFQSYVRQTYKYSP